MINFDGGGEVGGTVAESVGGGVIGGTVAEAAGGRGWAISVES